MYEHIYIPIDIKYMNLEVNYVYYERTVFKNHAKEKYFKTSYKCNLTLSLLLKVI